MAAREPVSTTAIQQAAETADLGAPIARVIGSDLSRAGQMLVTFGVLTTLFGGLATAGFFLSGWVPVIIIIAVVGVPFIGFWTWATSLSAHGTTWIYEHGIVEEFGQATALPWRDIVQVQEQEQRTMGTTAGEGQKYPTKHHYQLILRNGAARHLGIFQ